MAFITLNPAWKGRRAIVVPAHKAELIKQQLLEAPSDLTEEQYDFLNCVSKIYFNKDSPPILDVGNDTEHLLNEGIEQGMSQAIPKGDR